MDELKNLIQRNQTLIDDIEPIPGHADRFSKKLNKEDNFRSIIAPVLAAASIAIFITIGLFNMKINYENNISLGDISVEYQEAEIYYQEVFSYEYNKFRESTAQTLSLKNNIEYELEIMDKAYDQLLYDFRTNPYDARVINAIIMHHQTKVDFMKRINEQLVNNEVENVIDYNYESNRI
jgi:hypothetical protein